MRRLRSTTILLGSALALGCGGERGEPDGGGLTGLTTAGTAGSGTATDGNGNGSGNGTGDGSGSDGGGSSSGGILLDVGDGMDSAGGGDCQGGTDGALEFSYVWVANSAEATVSKVDTVTMVEEGRYRTAPETGFASPSRTSVSLSGDVAVANRYEGTGITKIIADPEKCVEKNGLPGIQTSTGKGDVYPFLEDECVAWNTPLDHEALRPVAWSPGTYDQVGCAWKDQKVWVAGSDEYTPGSVVVSILDGDDGAVEMEVPIPEISPGFYGPYGAAFDPDGNYWFVDSGNDGNGRALVRVNVADYSYDIWDTPPDFASYGFTVDTKGRPWVVSSHMGGLLRFDPQTETFDRVTDQLGIGIQEDAGGLMWIVHYPYSWRGVVAYDRDTMQKVKEIEVPTMFNGRGLSFDFFGKILVAGSTSVYRIDPATEQVDAYEGLDGAYTYSDMTGWGLKNVTAPPQG